VYFHSKREDWPIVPQPVVQEVADAMFRRYVEIAVLDPARYAFFVSVDDTRIDIDRVIASAPVLPSVRYGRSDATIARKLSSYQPVAADIDVARIITISGIKGGRKELRATIGAYSSPVGGVSWYVTLKRKWWKWTIIEWRHTGIVSRLQSSEKRPNKAPEPTTFAVTSRALERLPGGRAWTVQPIVARAAPAKVVAHL
jgi:hypothetical protein